jgi:hypothetical protein
MRPVRFVTRLIDDGWSSMSRCRLRDICHGRAGQWLDLHVDSLSVEIRD